jgi:hypothetical protein
MFPLKHILSPSRVVILALTATLLLLLSLPLSSCGPASPLPSNTNEAWNAQNDPRNLRDKYVVTLASLPLEASLARKPWTDSYWPSYRGGLANRWRDLDHPDPFTYALPTEAEVRAMSFDDLKNLSPAEKYDIYRGRFDYPFVAYERKRTHPTDPKWFGLCHGWAPAALNFDEPRPTTITTATGISLPFGAADVKALLGYVQQSGQEAHVAGARCNTDPSSDTPSTDSSPACQDINAGSFHVILANQIGLLQEGFVAEVHKTKEVWNHPVFGFESTIIATSTDVYPTAAPGTTTIVSVKTTMSYIVGLGAGWYPMPFDTFTSQGNTARYDYTLELDAAGAIIGGEWISEDHPDFFWTQAKPRFTGYLRDVEAIYAAATANP